MKGTFIYFSINTSSKCFIFSNMIWRYLKLEEIDKLIMTMSKYIIIKAPIIINNNNNTYKVVSAHGGHYYSNTNNNNNNMIV